MTRYVCVFTDPGKLYSCCYPTEDGIIANFHMAGELNRICQYNIIANFTIMSNVTISHKEAIVPNYCFPLILSTTVNGNKLANSSSVSNLNVCFFSCKLKVLRNGTDYGSRKNIATLTNYRILHHY